MATKLKAADIEEAIRALVTAEQTNLGVEVTLPVAYGDGEMVTVVVETADTELRVHDAGFSAMRLTAAGVTISKSVAVRLNEFAQRYRCTFASGRVTASGGPDDVPYMACLVANAARAVGDYVYELRRHAEYDFRGAVFDKLREIVGDRVRESEEFRGKSGRLWRVPIILDPAHAHPLSFIAPLANRSGVPQGFAMLYDLWRAYPEVERDVVYDETSDVREEDRALLSSAEAKVIGFMETQVRFREIAGHAGSRH